MLATRPCDAASESSVKASASAHANIALVKYWGKRDGALNLPARGSLSLTLSALTTRASVSFEPSATEDRLTINNTPADAAATSRLTRWLDIVRAASKLDSRATVDTESNFPTASGLASSASAFAALALAASAALDLPTDPRTLSILARRGSGSAARSIFGGLVRMNAGRAPDGTDCFAEHIEHPWSAPDSPLRMVIAIVGGGAAKAHSSRDAMQHCAQTSPLYPGWLESVDNDLEAAQAAIADGDFDALGTITEASALTMHATMMASRPGVVYFRPETLAIAERVRELRGSGVRAYYTMDAGPHVKILTLADQVEAVVSSLKELPDISEMRTSPVGGAASLEAA
jgi:diphosphomevalonate decarboxylase